MKYEMPILQYSFGDLEPFIDKETMEIHFTKHHQNYLNNLNTAVEGFSLFDGKSIEEVLTNVELIPSEIRKAVVNNGGGHFNHSFYWSIMSKDKNKTPSKPLLDKINTTFGSFDDFRTLFIETSLKTFGSGWTWLVETKDDGLKVYSTSNQDSPVSNGDKPLLCVDLWEHAYYLKYQNRRNEYLENWWNVIDWDKVSSNFEN